MTDPKPLIVGQRVVTVAGNLADVVRVDLRARELVVERLADRELISHTWAHVQRVDPDGPLFLDLHPGGECK